MVFSSKALKDPEVILKGSRAVVNAGRIESAQGWKSRLNQRILSGGEPCMITRLRPLSRTEVRSLDLQASEELMLPSLVLMENAGRGAAGWLAELVGAVPPGAGGRPFSTSLSARMLKVPQGPALPKVLVVCGPGNNGGDGGVVARHLDAWGFPVHVIWFARSDQLRGDAAVQWSILDRSGVQQFAWFDTHPDQSDLELAGMAATIAATDWIVDGLLGTGLARPVEGPLSAIIELMNGSGKPILALDLPSGLDADTGCPLGVAVHCIATATFVAAKLGFSTAGAADYTGELTIIDIGLPRRLLEPFRLA
jgi:NAD(P)H-hydrate epimerase